MYSLFGRQVFSAKNLDGVLVAIAELKSKLRDREPPANEFNAGFEQIIYTKSQSAQKSLVQYILKKVAIAEEQPLIGETDDLTIEHLLPQSKSSDEHPESIIGQLGNLVLVDGKTNNTLSNKDFKTKKQILSDTGYKLPNILLDSDEINQEIIVANTRRIAELSRNVIWKV